MRSYIKNTLHHGSSIKWLEIGFSILGIIALLYELYEYIPAEPVIILEVEKLETPATYLLTGADSDQNYSLEYVKIYPYFEQPVKQATFKYDHYIKKINLTESSTEQPKAYFISKEILHNDFSEQGFHFEFLDGDRFTFHFQFDGGEPNQPRFECTVVASDETGGKSVPCKVKEKGFLSSWFYTVNLSLIFILIIFLVFFGTRFLRSGKKHSWGKTKTKHRY